MATLGGSVAPSPPPGITVWTTAAASANRPASAATSNARARPRWCRPPRATATSTAPGRWAGVANSRAPASTSRAATSETAPNRTLQCCGAAPAAVATRTRVPPRAGPVAGCSERASGAAYTTGKVPPPFAASSSAWPAPAAAGTTQ